MSASAAERQLAFYSFLKRFDHRAPDVQAALSFNRICEDLVQRCAAALAAQAVTPYVTPPFPQGACFESQLTAEPTLLTAAWQAADLPAKQRSLFAELCRWLSGRYASNDPLSSSYQVWVAPASSSGLTLYGPAASDPPAGVRLVPHTAPPPTALHDNCMAFGHYDVHGLASLALCLRALRKLQVGKATGVMNFEMTGDIGKLWKRAIPQAIRGSEAPATVVMIDCPVHSRKPEYTLKAIHQLDAHPDVNLLLVDHHPDTLHLAPQLLHPQLQLVLTDVWSCSLLCQPDATDADLRLLGALGDKVPETAALESHSRECGLETANAAFHRALLHFSPTPQLFKTEERQPLEPLWLALADGKPIGAGLLASRLNLVLAPLPEAPALPDSLPCGALLFVIERLSVRGRDWYGLLEGLMQRDRFSYAAALRVLDGHRANMLLLTHWQDTHVPPVLSFVPESFRSRCLGHPAAVWVDLHTSEALPFLEQVAANASRFMDQPWDFGPVAAALQTNILDKPPSGPEQLDPPESA